MSHEHNILFIDDELQPSNSRLQLVESLNRDERFKVQAYHPVDIMKYIESGYLEDRYSVVIVDYKLNGNGNEKGELYSQNGYSMTSVFKEKLPYTPVYLISQVLSIEVGYGEHYDKMLSHNLLSKSTGRNLLANDCDSFKDLRDRASELFTFESIAKYMSIPSESIDDFRRVLPKEFKNGLSNKMGENGGSEVLDTDQAHIRFAKWVNTEFIVQSGPLIGAEELAVIMGIQFDFFEEIYCDKIKAMFEGLLYVGPFSKSNERRWWKQAVFSCLVDMLEPGQVTSPWKYIPAKLGLEDSKVAKCYVCHEVYPECIAYEEDDVDFRKKLPAHWRCTTLSEDVNLIPGYEPIYIVDE